MARQAKKSPARKRSLVTGACGFIGSHMVEVLNEAGHDIIAADLPSAWATDSLEAAMYPELVRSMAAETHSIDLADPGSLDVLPTDVDYVFHVASIFSYTTPLEVMQKVNVEGTRRLAERYMGSKKLKRWVQWGAGGVYGLPSNRDVEVFTEELAPEPGNNYLRSKWEQEFLVMELGRTKKLPYTIIRPTTVYGPRGGYGSRQLFLGVKDSPVVAIPGNLNGHIPYVHVRDVARAALHLAGHRGAKNEVYNLNDDTDMTTVEYMRALAKMYGKPFVKLPPVPLKQILSLLSPVLNAQFHLTRDVLKVKPLLEPDMLAYVTEDFKYSNDKLKGTGFQFAYPDARQAFPETLRWYLDHFTANGHG